MKLRITLTSQAVLRNFTAYRHPAPVGQEPVCIFNTFEWGVLSHACLHTKLPPQ